MTFGHKNFSSPLLERFGNKHLFCIRLYVNGESSCVEVPPAVVFALRSLTDSSTVVSNTLYQLLSVPAFNPQLTQLSPVLPLQLKLTT